MKAAHRRTLKRILAKPTPADIPWSDVQAMLQGAGVEVLERPGSWIALVKKQEIMVLRRPHPKPLSIRATLRDIAAFLGAAGVNS